MLEFVEKGAEGKQQLIDCIKESYKYDNEYLAKFTQWVQEWFVLNSFPVFLFKEENVLCEVGCGNCIRCLIKYKIFENLEEISYDISVRTKTIFPVTVLEDFVKLSKEIFVRIEEDV